MEFLPSQFGARELGVGSLHWALHDSRWRPVWCISNSPKALIASFKDTKPLWFRTHREAAYLSALINARNEKTGRRWFSFRSASSQARDGVLDHLSKSRHLDWNRNGADCPFVWIAHRVFGYEKSKAGTLRGTILRDHARCQHRSSVRRNGTIRP